MKKHFGGMGLLVFSLLVFSCASTGKFKMVDNLAEGVERGYLSFFSDFSYGSPSATVDIYLLDGGKRVLLGTTYDPLASMNAVVPELRIALSPGVHNVVVCARRLANVLWEGPVTVKQGFVTYAGIHQLTVGAYQTPGNAYVGGSSTTKYLTIVSVGSTSLPDTVVAPADPSVYIKALRDEDWATRRFALAGLSAIKGDLGEETLGTIRLLASDDRYAGVRAAARAALAGRGVAVSAEPLLLDSFVDFYGWSTGGKGAAGNEIFVYGSKGYVIQDSNPQVSMRPLKDLLAGVGFFGYDPSVLKNYRIELDCELLDGEKALPYGLVMGIDGWNFIGFSISRNGGAEVQLNVDGKERAQPIPWTNAASESIVSRQVSRIGVEVRGGRAAFSVNGIAIGSVDIDPKFLGQSLGLVEWGGMSVRFSRLALIELK